MDSLRRVRWLLFLGSLVVGCSSGGAPTSPTPAPGLGSSDITGTWVEVGGGTRTWTLSQVSVSAGGSASFSQTDNPHFGGVSGSGGVSGAIVLGAFMFAETYPGLTIPSRPSPNFCYIDTDGRLTISGNRMTGSYTEVAGCGGVRVGQATRSLTMQRQ